MKEQKTTTTVRLPTELYEAARKQAKDEFLSFTQLVCRLVTAYVKNETIQIIQQTTTEKSKEKNQ